MDNHLTSNEIVTDANLARALTHWRVANGNEYQRWMHQITIAAIEELQRLRTAEPPAAEQSDPYVPPCPPIEPFRQAAREVGYAIAEHGSKVRDYDLVAAPWTDDAVGNHTLVQHLLQRIPELIGKDLRQIGNWERKPLGRFACTLQIDGWYKHIDLSIAPRLSEPPSAMLLQLLKPIEMDQLIEWHTCCEGLSTQTDDFNGASMHRQRKRELIAIRAREPVTKSATPSIDEQLAWDQRTYGTSYQRIDFDGTRTRIDPATVMIAPQPADEKSGDQKSTTGAERGERSRGLGEQQNGESLVVSAPPPVAGVTECGACDKPGEHCSNIYGICSRHGGHPPRTSGETGESR